MPDIQAMIGKEVEVISNGMSYTGVLIEVSDSEVHLRGPLQWISLPTVSVSVIRPRGTAVQQNQQEEAEQIDTVFPHDPEKQS